MTEVGTLGRSRAQEIHLKPVSPKHLSHVAPSIASLSYHGKHYFGAPALFTHYIWDWSHAVFGSWVF